MLWGWAAVDVELHAFQIMIFQSEWPASRSSHFIPREMSPVSTARVSTAAAWKIKIDTSPGKLIQFIQLVARNITGNTYSTRYSTVEILQYTLVRSVTGEVTVRRRNYIMRLIIWTGHQMLMDGHVAGTETNLYLFSVIASKRHNEIRMRDKLPFPHSQYIHPPD